MKRGRQRAREGGDSERERERGRETDSVVEETRKERREWKDRHKTHTHYMAASVWISFLGKYFLFQGAAPGDANIILCI